MGAIQYKDFTIQEDWQPYASKPEFMFYPTSEGIQHDADGSSEGFKYTGNCKWADSIEEAKDQISEIVIQRIPFWKVVVDHRLGGFKVPTITKFDWLEDAMKFAIPFNGQIIPGSL